MRFRPYQEEAHKSAVNFVHKGQGNGVVVAECSAGKSLLMAKLAEHLHSCNMRAVVLADRSKLIKQNYNKFSNFDTVGIVSAGLNSANYNAPIVLGGIQTLYNKPHLLGHVDWIIADECETIGNNFQSDTRYHQFLRSYPSARLIGFTATPYTLSEGAISWGDVIHEITYQTLLDGGWCVPINNKIPQDLIGDSEIAHIGKEYNLAALSTFMRQQELIEQAAAKTAQYVRVAKRKKTLGFCVTVEHALDMARALTAHGLVVDMVHGGMSEEQREMHYDWFENGNTEILLNVELLTKGADFPCVDCIVCYRPTESMRLWFQILGRGIRLYKDKKECLLLDFSGNLKKFGTLGNPIWKYYGSEKKKVGKALKICPNCEEGINIGRSQCPCCGYVFEKEEIEKELKHAAEADLRSDMTKPHDPVSYYTVNKVFYTHHKSVKGNETLRVEYIIGRKSVSEYIPFGQHSPYAIKKCIKFMKGRSNLMPESIKEALRLCSSWPVPKVVKVQPQKDNIKYLELMEVEEWHENTSNTLSNVS